MEYILQNSSTVGMENGGKSITTVSGRHENFEPEYTGVGNTAQHSKSRKICNCTSARMSIHLLLQWVLLINFFYNAIETN